MPMLAYVYAYVARENQALPVKVNIKCIFMKATAGAFHCPRLSLSLQL